MIKVSPVHQPEYIRRRCKLCGDFYISAKRYVEVGFCEGCAKTNGSYVPKDRIGTYRVDNQPKEDQIEEFKEKKEEIEEER